MREPVWQDNVCFVIELTRQSIRFIIYCLSLIIWRRSLVLLCSPHFLLMARVQMHLLYINSKFRTLELNIPYNEYLYCHVCSIYIPGMNKKKSKSNNWNAFLTCSVSAGCGLQNSPVCDWVCVLVRTGQERLNQSGVNNFIPPSRLLGTPAARWPPHETGGRAGVQRFHRGGKSRAANTEADLRLAHRCRDALSSTRARPANGFLAASGNDNELNSLFSQPESPVMATSPDWIDIVVHNLYCGMKRSINQPKPFTLSSL